MGNSFCPFKETKILKSFISHLSYSSLSMVFKASVDGFKSTDFHRKCDRKEKLLVLIKANKFIFGYFFTFFLFFDFLFFNFLGGYNSSIWESNDKYTKSKENFIFSLSNPENKPTIFKYDHPHIAIYDGNDITLCFAGSFGIDLLISDLPNKNNNYAILKNIEGK